MVKRLNDTALPQKSATGCHLPYVSKTFASPSLGGYLRHFSIFCSLRLCELWLLCFNGAGYKHSYLLT